MQVDLEQLREVLSLQGNPLDASTLLGVCDSLGLNFEPTLDSCNWAGYPATWNRRGIPPDSSPSLTSLLEHQMLPKVASAFKNTLPIVELLPSLCTPSCLLVGISISSSGFQILDFRSIFKMLFYCLAF